jgi:hypothetical protein
LGSASTGLGEQRGGHGRGVKLDDELAGVEVRSALRSSLAALLTGTGTAINGDKWTRRAVHGALDLIEDSIAQIERPGWFCWHASSPPLRTFVPAALPKSAWTPADSTVVALAVPPKPRFSVPVSVA